MIRILLFSFLAICLFFGCQTDSSKSSPKSAIEIITAVKDTLKQPLLISDNLRSDRPVTATDTSILKQLQFHLISKFDPEASYFLLGQVEQFSGEYFCLLFFSDAPSESKAWIATYNKLGFLIDHQPAYHQKGDNPPDFKGYVRVDELRVIKPDKSEEKYPFYENGILGDN